MVSQIHDTSIFRVKKKAAWTSVMFVSYPTVTSQPRKTWLVSLPPCKHQVS